MILFCQDAVIRLMNFSREEIEKTLQEGNWDVKYNPDNDIMARAITYAWKKYPGRYREIGIFATCVEGHTTGLWGGFGQDNDPLMEKAENAVIALAGGIPSSQTGAGYCPVVDKEGRLFFGALTQDEFTKAGIQLLENICFASTQDAIANAIVFLENAIRKMEASKNAFKSKLIADARSYVEEAKKILSNI